MSEILVHDMSKADIALFKCPIIEGPNTRFCAVRAIDRQLQLLATADNVGALSPISSLFQRSRLCSPILGVEGTEALRGCAEWVQQIGWTKRRLLLF